MKLNGKEYLIVNEKDGVTLLRPRGGKKNGDDIAIVGGKHLVVKKAWEEWKALKKLKARKK